MNGKMKGMNEGKIKRKGESGNKKRKDEEKSESKRRKM